MANEDLHPLLSKIAQSIGALRTDVKELTGEVKKIPEVLREGFQSVRDAVHESIQAQAELKLLEHMADVHTVKPQISAEAEQIEAEKRELDERLEQIAGRYEERHRELEETAEERVRDLGSHIFELDEDVYERGVESPYLEHVPTSFDTLRSHNRDVRDERRERLRSAYTDADEAVSSYVGRREELLERIDDSRLDIHAGDEPQQLAVPVWVVEVERDGRTEREVVTPSRAVDDADEDGWFDATLRSFPGFDAVGERVADREVSTSSEPLPVDRAVDAVSAYGEADLAGQVAFEDELVEAVADDARLEVQEGAR